MNHRASSFNLASHHGFHSLFASWIPCVDSHAGVAPPSVPLVVRPIVLVSFNA